jgi:excisionase family DNA binding protein
MKSNSPTTCAPNKATLPFGTFDLNERGTVLKHWPTVKHKGKLRDFIRSVVDKNFFTDIAPYEELREFDYQAFLNGVWLEKTFELADEVKITFLRVSDTLSIALMPAPPKTKANSKVEGQRRLRATEIVRKKLLELNELEPVFSIRNGRIGFTTRIVRDDLLTVSEAAQVRGVTPQAIRYLVKQGKLSAIKTEGKQYLSRQEVETFGCLRCARLQTEKVAND